MFWIYEAKGFTPGKLDKMFFRQMKRKYIRYLKQDFCLDYKEVNDFDAIIPHSTMFKLRKFADKIEIDYHSFWRLAFHGYARAEGFHHEELGWELSGTQLRLYINDTWLYDSPMFKYLTPWFKKQGYRGLSVQDRYHTWQLKRMATRYHSATLQDRIQDAVEDDRVVLSFLRKRFNNLYR